MKPTPQQQMAISTHDRNVIVVAGAGSGKTRVLVERYLALLAANPNWPLNALVAVTFTRKAAAEMRDRVRATLEKNRSAALHSEDPRERQRWTALLAAMDSARIDTIHALCADLLRANAAEASLDPDFTVLDETESVILLARVVDDVLSGLAAAAADSDDADSALALTLFDVYDERDVREALADFALLRADIPPVHEATLAAWRADYDRTAAAELDRLCSDPDFSDAALFGRQTHIPADDLIGAVWLAVLPLLDELYHAALNTRLHALHALQGAINLTGGKASAWGGKPVLDAAKDSLRHLREAAEALEKSLGPAPGDLDERALALLRAWSALINRVRAAYAAAKRTNAVLDFDDLEALTSRLLADHPSVAARYRGGTARDGEFRHLLVDEFQDTNAAQWHIIQHLAGLDTPGSLFVVGDPKQSIYAFRGADVGVFEAVRRQITQANGVSVSLSQSFRTHQPLVTEFNALFERILIQNDALPDYFVRYEAMTAARALPPHDAPHVQLLLIDKKSRDEKLSAEDCRRWEAFAIAQQLHTMIADGFPVYDKEHGEIRPMRWGDAALLFQSTGSITRYEAVLQAQHVPYITLAGRGYFDRQEVRDLIQLLRALHNPADNLALASVLHSPLFGLSSDALLALRVTGLPLWDALNAPGDLFPQDEITALGFARDALYRLQQSAGRVTISELLSDALATTGFAATLSGLPGGAQRRGNVDKLLELAHASGKITLSAFEYYLSDLSAREVREGSAALEVDNAVQLMTVHASKGLEFPVVVLVDCSWTKGAAGRGGLLSYDGELGCKLPDDDGTLKPCYSYRRADQRRALRDDAERRRLLYVAATRAQDRLIVSGTVEGRDSKTQVWKTDGWLKWLLDVVPASVDGIAHTVMPPQSYPSPQDFIPEDARTLWDSHAVRMGQPLSDEIREPLLLRPVVHHPHAQARHLAATAIAHIGGAEHAPDDAQRSFARSRFLREVIYDAPAAIQPIQMRERRVQARQVGDVVHAALRWWRVYAHAAPNDQRALLESYAWEQGITTNEECAQAVQRAQTLLAAYRRSPLHHEIEDAARVYRELPFIYERDTHIIRGMIDVLYQRPDGTWVLVDYKTGYVPSAGDADAGDRAAHCAAHARQFYLQVGIYAEAVRAVIGQAPESIVHYIRYNQSVPIPAAALEAQLAAGLGSRIARLVER